MPYMFEHAAQVCTFEGPERVFVIAGLVCANVMGRLNMVPG